MKIEYMYMVGVDRTARARESSLVRARASLARGSDEPELSRLPLPRQT